MSRHSRRATRSAAPESRGPLTRADRLQAIGDGEPDPCANDESVITRATRLEAIGNGEPDPTTVVDATA